LLTSALLAQSRHFIQYSLHELSSQWHVERHAVASAACSLQRASLLIDPDSSFREHDLLRQVEGSLVVSLDRNQVLQE
jgi:hypothetical protein